MRVRLYAEPQFIALLSVPSRVRLGRRLQVRRESARCEPAHREGLLWTRLERPKMRSAALISRSAGSRARASMGPGGKDQRTSSAHRQSISCRTASQLNGHICQCGHSPRCK
jgi:hypothetical protein